jgi:glyoxylase-like metal-dependent hydrolase (beta-lactamase superfamily II)
MGTPDAQPGAFCDALGSFPAAWISGGSSCGSEPEIQVHQLNADTYILRQSLCTSFEAPFMYLLFGDDKALLEDTGDGGIDIVGTVADLIDQREAQVGHQIELVVANSHAHGDHVQGNQAFANAGATMVGLSVSSIVNFFDLPGWPVQLGSYELGNRQLEIMGIPGHESRHIAIYDTKYGFLLTGDTLYPGRLYVSDFAAYKQSINALTTFAQMREVCSVLGTHIEMTTTPGDDYDFGVTSHPNEHPLQLGVEHLAELRDAVNAMGNTPVRDTHDDFIVYPL